MTTRRTPRASGRFRRLCLALAGLAVGALLGASGCSTDKPAPDDAGQNEPPSSAPAAADAQTPQPYDLTPDPLGGLSNATPTTYDQAVALIDERAEWIHHQRPLDIPRHPAEKYLDGWVIVLDPGHGGRADVRGYKRGPTGVREAEMNLRVAYLLARLLRDAGATVELTRTGETSERANDNNKATHKLRADLANTLERPDGGTGADLFISIHHNAASRPTANYSSVWFHGASGGAEPDLDVAKYVAHRLGAHLRTDVGLTAPLHSDRQMYASGFAVLRLAQVPAILLESSFFSHPEEEQRLRDAGYNLREAYAVYEGLCEYAYGGRPTQSPPEAIDASSRGDADPESLGGTRLQTVLDDGLPKGWWGNDRLRTLPSTISVFVDGERIASDFDPETSALEFTLPDSAETEVVVAIHHANEYKHHNFPQRYAVTLDEGAVAIQPLGSAR
ncbi:MAG: N-acetylmuramoyl-L-alanine amidase [Planctomycetota bacterium]